MIREALDAPLFSSPSPGASEEGAAGAHRARGNKKALRILFALPGLHRVVRGAEVALEEVARELAALPGHQVTLIGSGRPRAEEPYRFVHAPCLPRERFERGWPKFPGLRDHYQYEELSFAPGLLRRYHPDEYDVTVTCGYPYTNWILGYRTRGGYRPRHVFVTQNGDWMVHAQRREFRYFACDGLVCTNHEYHARAQADGRYPSALIPNGVNPAVFTPGRGDRGAFGLSDAAPVALMVSALTPSKRVLEGVRAAAGVAGLQLVVVGDGELRREVTALGRGLMGERFHNLTLPRHAMPEAYRCADVLLHMSQDEPFGIVYVEALAAGLPIVTSDRAVTRWALEDQAILVDSSDQEAVTDGLRRAIGRKTPPEVAARRALVDRRFAWSSIAGAYSDFFHQIGR
jgi:glycosyltransferase involved in cell wall biosynthesis